MCTLLNCEFGIANSSIVGRIFLTIREGVEYVCANPGDPITPAFAKKNPPEGAVDVGIIVAGSP